MITHEPISAHRRAASRRVARSYGKGERLCQHVNCLPCTTYDLKAASFPRRGRRSCCKSNFVEFFVTQDRFGFTLHRERMMCVQFYWVHISKLALYTSNRAFMTKPLIPDVYRDTAIRYADQRKLFIRALYVFSCFPTFVRLYVFRLHGY